MKAVLLSLGQRLTAGLFLVVQALLIPLPLGWTWRLGAALGRLFAVFSPRYRRLVESSLKRCLGGELDEGERQRIRRQHFAQVGGNLLCGLQLPRISEARIRRAVTLEHPQRLAEACQDGRGAVLSLAHQSCWELLSQIPFASPEGQPIAAIYQTLRNPHLDSIVRAQRQRRGTRLFSRSDGFLSPLRHVRSGGLLGILADQHAGNAGTWLPFFGRLASTTTLPALLARRAHAALLPVEVRTTAAGRWTVSFGELESAPGDQRSPEQITLKLLQRLEQSIRSHPADWFWVHQRWKTPTPNFLWSGGQADSGVVDLPHDPFRLIVRSPNWLGDACMAVPMVRALKAGRPQLELTILCRDNLAPFWRRMPGVDEVIAVSRALSPRRVGTILHQHGPFDAAILCPNSTRSALELHAGGIHPIVGTAGQFLRRKLIDEVLPPRPPGPPRHHVEHYLDLARLAGAATDSPEFFQTNLTTPLPGRIGIVAGAEYGPAKRWPADRFAATIDGLAAQHPDWEFYLFGTPAEREIGDEILRLAGPAARQQVVNRTGATRLDGLMDELAQCRLVIANDTGGMHLAASLGVPVVAIFGSTEPAWTRPLGRQHRVLRRHVACSPCFLRDCPLDFRCMQEISAELVIANVLSLLAEPFVRKTAE